jgi:hypothetical protein
MLIFDEINSVIQIDSTTLEVTDCVAACCMGDNCNEVSVEELNASGAPIMTSSTLSVVIVGFVTMVVNKLA